MKETLSKITKKDLVYGIILLILINVFLIVLFFATDKDLVAYFGFAGTMTGIILAVVALIYTFYQNITLGNSSLKLEEFARKVSEFSGHLSKLDKLDNISNDIGESIEQLNLSTKESILVINAAVSQLAVTFTDELRSHRDHFDQTLHNFQETTNPFIFNHDILDVNDINIESEQSFIFLSNSLPHFILIAIYSFIDAADKNKTINLYSYLKWAYEIEIELIHTDSQTENNPSDINLIAFLGFLNYFRKNNWLLLTGEYTHGSVVDIDPLFSESIKRAVHKLDNEVIMNALSSFYSIDINPK